MVNPTTTRLLIGVAALVTAACQPLPLGGPVGTPSPESELIGCDRAGEPLVLTADAHLDPSCTYSGPVDVVASDVTLDCRGAHITDAEGDDGRGVHVHAPTDVALSDVTVRNCVITGFLNNIRVSRDGFKDLVEGAEYEAPFARITLENNRLVDSRGSGIFVNAYVTDVTIQDTHISGSGSVGIYLEAGSKGNTVRRNHIHHNGFGEVDPVNGVPQVVGGIEFRVLMSGREGIAIDGSRDNVVSSNSIHDNAAGGIFLYKNCGEFATERPGQWWHRPYGADGNLVEGNDIVAEDDGIWVGSRMSQDQYFMDCSDPTYDSGSLRAIHRDAAAGNTIRGNTIVGAGNAIRVEDDDTTVEGNVIHSDDAAGRGVLVGTKERTELLGEPVDGTTITGNEVHAPDGFAAYTWVFGHTATTFSSNYTGGAPATLVEGTPPPVDRWLFVERVWLP